MFYIANIIRSTNINLLLFYCINEFKVYVDKNHDVYVIQ